MSYALINSASKLKEVVLLVKSYEILNYTASGSAFDKDHYSHAGNIEN